jgi:Tfp pilus assembly protein PilO
VRPFWRRRLLGPAVALLALNMVAFLAYTRPRAERERDVAARAVGLREEVGELRARVGKIRERARALETNAADVGRFYAAMGPKDSVLAVQEDVVALGRQLGLAIGPRRYQHEVVKRSKGLARFRIGMPVAGNYRQVAGFLHRLEAMRRFVTVDSIALAEDSGAAGRTTNLTISISVYFLEPGGSAADES